MNNSWHNYYENTTLTSVSIPATVKEIGRRAFYNCTALSNLRFAGTSQLTTIGEGAFCDCESLTNLTIPDSVTTVGSQAFSGLDSLKNLTLSGEANSSAWGISSYRNGWLETITYTGSFIRSGSREYNANGGYWIEYPGVVSGAKKLILAETVTEISDYAFGYGYPTEEVEIRGKLTSIGEYAFEGFYNLKTINLPDSLTHLGKGCFHNCNGLEYLTLSKIPDVINEAVFSLKNKATIPDFIIQATNGKVSLNWHTAGVTEEDDDYWKIAGIGYWNSDDLSLICEGTGQVKLVCVDSYTGLRGSKIIQVNGGLLLEPMELGYMIAGQSQQFTAYDIAGTYSKVSATWRLTEGGEYASITTSGMQDRYRTPCRNTLSIGCGNRIFPQKNWSRF